MIKFSSPASIKKSFGHSSHLDIFATLLQIILTSNLPYRQFIAALLLALYAFIIAPVQLWHHHEREAVKESSAFVASADDAVFASDTDVSSDTDCPVCQHQYAACDDDASVPGVTIISTPATINEGYAQHAFSAFALTASNKGPPSFS
ncbi:hypothetical protein LZZ85_14380 [Terrimonas sp. NA20]|uniref:DUF2946 domain-containing protein n=1 Tax=Terrimonas ginsenosidimutans TaxID=2908004 RepID=A0ABS9KT32_9BACT|nr:hypothetical protein [Terrimonas ginsenosidimutans]MCG2615483.1 hypothetical protein [Terrimonas ginsenosidimutans]